MIALRYQRSSIAMRGREQGLRQLDRIRTLQASRQDSLLAAHYRVHREAEVMNRIVLIALMVGLAPARDVRAQQLIIGPTAQAMKQGDVSISLSALVGGPTIQVGVTDRVSIGAGAPMLIPGVSPADHLVVTPKVQLFSSGKTNVAVGAAHVLNRDEPDGGIAYSVVTRGTSNASVTAGVLCGY